MADATIGKMHIFNKEIYAFPIGLKNITIPLKYIPMIIPVTIPRMIAHGLKRN
jgi:hypothetical protein